MGSGQFEPSWILKSRPPAATEKCVESAALSARVLRIFGDDAPFGTSFLMRVGLLAGGTISAVARPCAPTLAPEPYCFAAPLPLLEMTSSISPRRIVPGLLLLSCLRLCETFPEQASDLLR
jgi:hypothetical protein